MGTPIFGIRPLKIRIWLTLLSFQFLKNFETPFSFIDNRPGDFDALYDVT